jgi:hypothetical protein
MKNEVELRSSRSVQGRSSGSTVGVAGGAGRNSNNSMRAATTTNKLHDDGGKDVESQAQNSTDSGIDVMSMRSAKNREFEQEKSDCEEGDDNDGSDKKMKKLCGIYIPRPLHPYITFWRTTVEIVILGVVFGLSMQYFSSVTAGTYCHFFTGHI